MNEQSMSFDAFLNENSVDKNDVESMKKAIDDYANMLKTAQESVIDVSTLDADSLARHVNYSVNSLTTYINEVDLTVFKDALNVCNQHVEKQNERLKELYEIRSNASKEIASIKEALGTSGTIKTFNPDETPRQEIGNALDSSYDDCANSAKSRRNFLIKAFSLAKSRSEKVNFSTLYNLSKTRSKLDFDKFNSNQIAACKTVCKQDLGIKWESVLNVDMIYEEKEYRMI